MTPQTARLDQLLGRKRDLERHAALAADFAPRLASLRRWQAARLARTYSDLRADPRHAPGVEFFLSDLYGPHDFDARDRQLLRAWRYFRRALPAPLLRALGHAVELDLLTVELDHAMVDALPAAALSDARYAQAYRTIGRRDARARQIELVIAAGEDLERAVHHAWIAPLLKAAHAPAYAAGFGALQDFIERGFGAFRAMSDVRGFLAAVRERETTLMDAWFAEPPT